MVKQKKNKDINNTIINKESTPNIDKIDHPIIPTVKEAAPIVVDKAKTPVSTNISKSKKLSLEAVDQDLKVQASIKTSSNNEQGTMEPIAIDTLLFENKWKDYIAVIRSEFENAGLAMSLEQASFKIDVNKIDILVNSVTTKELVEKNKGHLIEYLAKELDNDSIKVHITVSEQAAEMNKKSLSPNDKLKIMMENNPAVVDLVKLLNLEIDY